MPGSFTNFASAKLLDHIFGGMSFPSPSLFMGYTLSASGDTGQGTEPAGGNYSRTAVPPSVWSVASQTLSQILDVVCPRASANQGTIVGVTFHDSSTAGNCLAYVSINGSLAIDIRDSIVIPSGSINMVLEPGGFSNYLKNAILNHVFRNIQIPIEPLLYHAYFTVAPTDSTAGTEPTGNAYARQVLNNNLSSWSPTAGGFKLNALNVTFPIATGNQGSITHSGIFNLATGGQLLGYGVLNNGVSDVPFPVPQNSQIIFDPGTIKLSLD